MNFITDQQTLNDLNLLGKHRRGSVFSLFSQVRTRGGERLLEEMFRHPLTDAEAINSRSGLIRYFSALDMVFPMSGSQVEAMENYLGSPGHGHLPAAVWHGLRRKLMASLVRDETDGMLREGLSAAVNGLRVVREFLRGLMRRDPDGPFSERARAALNVLEDRMLAGSSVSGDSSLVQVARYDYLLRTRLRAGLETVMTVLSELDVYIGVGSAARVNGWGYAGALPMRRQYSADRGLAASCRKQCRGQ
ncbi:hypothetical protein ACQ86N_34205 [Puia sp. P3]|uniref:hypothetical protein n=1 Tax=Puia sp. P3 TaxID=3423952 RepID=UPI003D677701